MVSHLGFYRTCVCTRFWKDYTLIFSSSRCLDALTAVATARPLTLLHNHSVRCFGFCPEEQTEMVLEQSGCRFVDLNAGSEIDQSVRSLCAPMAL
jgi:hypothetical protein